MVTTLGEKDFVIATALLIVAAPMVYFGCRGALDTFTLRVTDINPLYWVFRWRYRSQPREETDRAFVRFFWRLNLILIIGYAVTLIPWAIQLFASRH